MFSIALCLSLLPFIAAQATVAEFKGIEAHFTQSAIVPELLASFKPSALVDLTFNGVGEVTPGQALTKEQTGTVPTVTLTPANSSTTFSGNYTIFMVDADIVGTDDELVNKHWLVNGATVVDDKISVTGGVGITPYAGPGPAAGSGAHRYVVLIYEQTEEFIAPADFTQPSGVSKFSLSTYLTDSRLGPLVAGTYITVEEGTASASVSSTAAVVSSTLATSASAGPSTTGTGSSTGTAPSSTPSNAAVTITGSFLAIVASFTVVFLA